MAWSPVLAALHNVALAAGSVPTWDYALLLALLATIVLYHLLDFHIIGDILSGWRGDVIDLYYNPTSRVSTQLLAKCEVLKKRYWPTAWLCSPHLQTLFLHFFGRSPRVDYLRQLYITSDGGTIALDWVKSHKFTGDGSGEDRRQIADSDETPTAIIVPGLTSDASNHYVKHVAGGFAKEGWRVLVANHRGLGGVSITSNQFYNAGWTEDLRNIILLVQRKYPKSPLLAIGTSIGANILVKYLGEEGPKTPLGGAVAICCPWDLLVCDRFMQRRGLQTLYNKALATGLQEYAVLHQIALSRMVDWALVSKSASIRDFDDNCTRHVGKYETVDTYYRKCSSAQFVEAVAVPLLCISAEDDPICTKGAIPYDECRVNPNIILGVSRHGGHLAYFEGFNASSIWWVRAAREFARVLLSSSLLHQQNRVGDIHTTRLGPNIDKGPFLTMAEDLTVAAQDSGYDQTSMMETPEDEEPSCLAREVAKGPNASTASQGRYMVNDKSVDMIPSHTAHDVNNVAYDDCGGPLYRPVGAESQWDADNDNLLVQNEVGALPVSSRLAGQPSVTLHLRSLSEVAALRSALSQLLEQVPPSSPSIVEESSQPIQVPLTSSVVAGFGKCMGSTRDLLVTRDTKGKTAAKAVDGHTKEAPTRSIEKTPPKQVPIKDIGGLASENRRTLWLLMYIALVTTFPFLGSALLVRTRGRLLQVLSWNWLKRRF